MPRTVDAVDVDVVALESDLKWKAKCQHCAFVITDLQTGNGAEAVARAHSVIHKHDVEYSWSVIDCLEGVIRANDPRY